MFNIWSFQLLLRAVCARLLGGLCASPGGRTQLSFSCARGSIHIARVGGQATRLLRDVAGSGLLRTVDGHHQ
jgi:hypothetical protein